MSRHEAQCQIVHETSEAILIETENRHEHLVKVWVPLSQVDAIHRNKGKPSVVVMSEWIAQQKGLV